MTMHHEEVDGPRVALLLGSARPGSYTGHAARWLARALRRRGAAVDLVELGDLRLPQPGRADDPGDARQLQARVAAADAVVLATPEYHGSFSSLLKLAIEHLGFPSVLAGKRVALLGVAAGRLGAVKSLEHLRGVCAHVGAHTLPQAFSIAEVQSRFDEAGRCLDPDTEAWLDTLADQTLAFHPVAAAA